MGLRGRQGRAWTGAIGVLVLYALAFQGILGAVASTRMSLQAPGVICSGHLVDPAEDRDGGSEHDACCTTACRLAHVVPPVRTDVAVPIAGPVLEPRRVWLTLRFHGPPSRAHRSASPRAPPAFV